MARDTVATDRVIYSTDEGLTWHDFKLKLQDNIRVRSIVAVPQDTGRHFVLLGYYPHSMGAAVAVHLDFSSLTKKQCALFRVVILMRLIITSIGVISDEITDESDYEFWNPAVEQHEICMFGRQVGLQPFIHDAFDLKRAFQTIFQRRIRDRNCYIGDMKPLEEHVVWNCPCTDNDFEW